MKDHMEEKMQKVKYAIVPRFTVRKKGKILDVESIEQQFGDWIKQYTGQGYVIGRNTTIAAVLEPGCFARLILQKKVEFTDFEAIEFHPCEQAVDYVYRIAPIFIVKSRKLKTKEKKKISGFDAGLALFEEHRPEFEELINNHINQIAQQGLKYTTSAIIKVRVEPGCLGMLRGKQIEYIDFEAYEFVRTQEKPTYKCKIFPRFKSKAANFKFEDLENYIAEKVQPELVDGFNLAGKVAFDAFMTTGCFGKGELVGVDAFLFEK